MIHVAIRFLLLLGLGVSISLVSAEPAAQRPNILIVLADDLGFGELGCYGQTKIKTPHIDRLATEGVRFTRAYAGNAVCAPSRCVLLTGLHPGHAQVRNNREINPEGQVPLAAGTETLGTMLRRAGYATGAFGKWGLGGPGSTGAPENQGFDRFFGYLCQRVAHSYYPDRLWSDDQPFPLNNKPPVPGHGKLPPKVDAKNPDAYAQFKGQDYAPDRIHQAALAFISKNKDRPFLCYYPTPLPHLALQIPDPELKPYRDLQWDDPPFDGRAGGYTPHFTPRAAYAAMITRIDNAVGELMAHLKQLGLDQRTVVIVTSDNGATHLNREVDVEFFQSAAGLRGLKGSLYEGGIRIPFIVWGPAFVRGGVTSADIIGFEDIMPTCAELAGLNPPATDGVSLLPALKGTGAVTRNYLYREFPGYGGQQAVWFGKWKAIRTGMARGPITTQLYDLEQDPGEGEDLAQQFPDILKQGTELFLKAHKPSTAFPLRGVDH